MIVPSDQPQPQLSFTHTLIWGLRWQTISNVGVAVLGAVYLLYLGNILGLEQFGLFATATAVSTFAYGITDCRLSEGALRFLILWQDVTHKRAAFVKFALIIDITTKFFVCVLLLIISPLLANYFVGSPDFQFVFGLAAFVGFIGKVMNLLGVGLLRMTNQVDVHAKSLLLAWGLKLTATIILLQWIGPDIIRVLSIALIFDGFANFLVIRAAYRILKTEGIAIISARISDLGQDRSDVHRFLRGSLGISIADSFVRELDTMIVASFLSLQAVGLYRMAKNIVSMGWRIVDPIHVIIMPIFTQMIVKKDTGGIRHLTWLVTIIVFGFSVLVLLLSYLFLPILIPIVLNREYTQCIVLTLLMMIGLVVGAPFIWTHPFWMATGKPHVQLIANLIGAGIATVAFLLLTPRFGLQGASIAFALTLASPFVFSSIWWLKEQYIN